MSRKIKALVVSAHPDDETLFFGGLILQKKYDWTVICITDGNADGLGNIRQRQFGQACRLLGVKNYACLQFPDNFRKRLSLSKIISALHGLGRFDVVFTHDILGEYGHPHHQDVSYAVHKAFEKTAPVFSTAYNILPDIQISLRAKDFGTKTKILATVYTGETRRFLHFLPATSSEGFSRISHGEVEALYTFCLKKTLPSAARLKRYRWLRPYFSAGYGHLKIRPF